MILTSEYQYIGRSNAVPANSGASSYFILLYAKSVSDFAAGNHAVSVKQRIACTSKSSFYGYASSARISINGEDAISWERENVPDAAWNEDSLTEAGITYLTWADLREATVTVQTGYGVPVDIAIYAFWECKSDSANYLPKKNCPAEVSSVATLPAIVGASQPTASSSSVELGFTLTIRTNAIGSFTHTLTYQFGESTGVIAENVVDSVSWQPSLDLAYQIPNSTVGKAIITCTTFSNGLQIGAPTQLEVTLFVPDSVLPRMVVDVVDASEAYETLGIYLQNVSKLNFSTNGSGAYGSEIVKTSVTLAGKSYSGAVITDAGDLQYVATVTDSRGRSASQYGTISVMEYTAPQLTINASRCTIDGVADDTGKFARITLTGYVSPVQGNTATLTLHQGDILEDIPVEPGEISVEHFVIADPNNTLSIEANLADALFSITRSMRLSTGYATLDLLNGGKGISFGKAATREGFDCAMPAFFTEGLNGIHLLGFSDSGAVSGPVFAVISKSSSWGMYLLMVTTRSVTSAYKISGELEASFTIDSAGHLQIVESGITGWFIGFTT